MSLCQCFSSNCQFTENYRVNKSLGQIPMSSLKCSFLSVAVLPLWEQISKLVLPN